MYRRLFTIALMSTLFCASVFGWGQKGHDIVACIAEKHLTKAASDSIKHLLDGKSIVYWANWLDNASHTPEYAYTKTWHYKNVDADKTFDSAPLHKDGDIVRALDSQILLLQDPDAADADKVFALKIVIHLLGDIHQPLHMGHASDRGGNRWFVKNFRRDTNLHSTWDSFVPEQAHKWSYTEWQQQIDRADEKTESEIISGGTPESWGRETYEICRTVYDTTSEGSTLSYDYVAEWTPVVEYQFLKGGLRLADLLNSLFDPSYIPANDAVKGKNAR